jgi:hypothetical protein
MTLTTLYWPQWRHRISFLILFAIFLIDVILEAFVLPHFDPSFGSLPSDVKQTLTPVGTFMQELAHINIRLWSILLAICIPLAWELLQAALHLEHEYQVKFTTQASQIGADFQDLKETLEWVAISDQNDRDFMRKLQENLRQDLIYQFRFECLTLSYIPTLKDNLLRTVVNLKGGILHVDADHAQELDHDLLRADP